MNYRLLEEGASDGHRDGNERKDAKELDLIGSVTAEVMDGSRTPP